MPKYFKTILLLILFQALVHIVSSQTSQTATEPYALARMYSDPNYVRVMTIYKRTQMKIPPDQLRAITTLGLLNGAIKAEKNLEKHLTDKVTDLVLNTNVQQEENRKQKIAELERILQRDQMAIRVLANVLDLASQSISSAQYKNQLKKIMREDARGQKQIRRQSIVNMNADDKMTDLKTKILDHVATMKSTIEDKTNKTMLYLKTLSHLKDFKVHRTEEIANQTSSNTSNDILQSVITDNVNENLIDQRNGSDSTEFSFDEFKSAFSKNRLKRKLDRIKSSKAIEEVTKGNLTRSLESENSENSEKRDTSPKQSNDDDELGLSDDETSGAGGGGGGGGLPGLIASLSGGEEGSDIGALLGAVTGLVSQLFGPGGLDIPSLINTATSLVAGLLGGGRNFGIVLGEYVGLALDGLSGGGGADLNGEFLGNFVGSTLAELSADPEDEDGPPKPFLFIQNFLKNFLKAKNRMGGASGEENSSGEKRSTKKNKNAKDGGDQTPQPAGSDSFGFIKHIVSAIAGGVTSFILNASLGSSSGSAKGSTGASASSSDGSGGKHHRSSHN